MDNIYKAVQLTIDSQNLALSKTPTHVYIANQYVDTNDTPLITAPFIIQKALENGTGVVDIVSSTIGSIYEVRLLCDAEVLISGYFYMPPMNVNFSELELYTSYPPRTPPVVNEFWQKTENFILEKTNTLLNFVQVFNAVSSMRLSLGYLEELLTTKKSNLVSAINEVLNKTKEQFDIVEEDISGINDLLGDVKENGWTDVLIETLENLNQRQINDGLESIAQLLSIKNPRTGMRVYVKSYYTGLGKGGGEFVYNESNAFVYDGGVSFGKWRRQFVTLTPQHFGVIGDFSDKTLADFYSQLSDAQTIFSTAVALDELHDRVAFATYLKYLMANQVRTDWTAQILLDKSLISYTNAKTLLIDGSLSLKGNKANLKYCLHIATNQLVLTGSVETIGTSSNSNDIRTRYIEHGVVCGADTDLGLTGSAQNCDFGTIIGSNILGFALAYLANCHFSTTRQVRGANAGSSNAHSIKYLQGFVDSFTFVSSSGGDIGQKSLLQVTDVALLDRITKFDGLRVIIRGLPYDVIAVDSVNKQVSIYPQLPPSITSGDMLYVFGGAALITSNNTACTSIGVCEAIVCGYGLHIPALYGVSINSFTTEYCGIGIGISTRSKAHLGTTLQLAYFEANKVDILYGWALSNYNALNILQNIALNPNKIYNMVGYTIGEIRRRDWSAMGGGNVYLSSGVSINLETNLWEIHAPHYSNTTPVGGSSTVTLGYDPVVAQLTGRYSKIVNLIPATSNAIVTLNAPTGYTVNGSSSVSINMGDYDGVISVGLYVYPDIVALVKNITVVVSGNKKTLSNSVTYDPPSIAASSSVTTNVTLTGAKVGDIVQAAFSNYDANIDITAVVSATNVVTVKFKNNSASAVDLASGTLTVKSI